jgi:hypothetical protein
MSTVQVAAVKNVLGLLRGDVVTLEETEEVRGLISGGFLQKVTESTPAPAAAGLANRFEAEEADARKAALHVEPAPTPAKRQNPSAADRAPEPATGS